MLTTEELLRRIETENAGVKTHVSAEFKKAGDALAEVQARLTGVEQEITRRPGHDSRGGAQNSVGAALTKHPDFSQLARLAETRGKMTLAVKAMISTLPDSGGALIPRDVRVGDAVTMPRQRLTVRDLVSQSTTVSNLVSYPRQTVRDLNAAVVSEGAQKPESNIAFEMADAPVRTIAHWTKASRQILSDAPVLRSTLDGELRYGIQLNEELEMLFGDGSGVHLFGLIPQAEEFNPPIAHPEMETAVDTLKLAIAQSQQALLPATGIVVNDLDLESFQLLKDANGRYLFGGPAGPPITTLWGRPVVGTPAMPQDHFLVGAFKDGAHIYDREEVNVMVATENEDDFTHNLATILAEERLAFTVRRPQGFVYGFYGAVSGSG